MLSQFMTVSYWIDMAFPSLSIIALILVLAVRREFVPVVLITIIWWVILNLYYPSSTVSSLLFPAPILELDEDPWLIARAVLVVLHLFMLLLYLIFNKKTFFYLSYGIVLILSADYLHYSGSCMISKVGEILDYLHITYLSFAGPMLSTVGLALTLAIREKYKWFIVPAVVYWVALGFYYSVNPLAVFICPFFVQNGDHWLFIKGWIFLLYLLLLASYLIFNRKSLFWICYCIMTFLIVECIYGFSFGEYFGP
ncbi:MAG: hypothetical protein ACYS72_00325 [Planctomycetota bacterium]|jgi:hypothetical protein